MNSAHQQILDSIKNTTLILKDQQKQPLIAAFDADGTLWSTDVGEEFFEFQLKNKLIKNPLPEDPWKYYFDLKKQDPRAAYLWFAQVLKGHSVEKVREWNKDLVKSLRPFSLFEFQKQLIEFFHQNDVEVYVVTASIKWAVEAPASLYGIKASNVVGVKTSIENGIITDKQDGAVTYREGKVEGLLENTKNIYPFFVAGNTMGDYELLKSSQSLKLAVHSVDENHPNFSTEQELQAMAAENSWLRLVSPKTTEY